MQVETCTLVEDQYIYMYVVLDGHIQIHRYYNITEWNMSKHIWYSGGIPSQIIDHGTRLRRVINITPCRFIPERKISGNRRAVQS
jgi:hypothetical protein